MLSACLVFPTRASAATSAGTFLYRFQEAPIKEAKDLKPSPEAGKAPFWVLRSLDEIPVAPPPSVNSSQEKQELAELKDFAARRTPQILDRARYWSTGAASLRWSEVQSTCIMKYTPSPPRAARGLALVHTAIQDALTVAYHTKYQYKRMRPVEIDPSISEVLPHSPDPVYLSEHAVVAGAASRMLAFLFPSERHNLETMAREVCDSRLWAGLNYRSDVEAGLTLGQAVADRFIQYAREDRAPKKLNDWDPSVRLTGEAYWQPTVTDDRNVSIEVPNEATWGKVKTWLMTSGDQFRPGPPPVYGSKEFLKEAKDVEEVGNKLSDERKRIAIFWADGPGTMTPPGHWVQLTFEWVQRANLSTAFAARVLATVTAAQHDAFVSCWDTKYAYWSVRPVTAIQRWNPNWRPFITTPPFPSYISGHSTVTMAVAETLVHFFPKSARELRRQALEASMSRLYGGIHYRSDLDVGRVVGKKIAELAIARDRQAAP